MTASPQPVSTPTPEQVRAAWNGVATGFDEHVTPANIAFGEEVLDRLGSLAGSRFLDVAAGTGALAIPAARRGAQVVAVDLSPAMVDRLSARAAAEGLSGVEARVMDAHALAFDDGAFDVAASQHGVSLLPDLDKGLGELVRVTKPGGRVLVVAFGQPQQAEFLTFFLGALKAAVPGFTGPPLDPPPLPFQVADPEALRRRLTTAGLLEVGVRPAVWDLPIRSAQHLWDLVMSSNPLAATFVADLGDQQIADARQVLDGMLRERSGGRPQAVLHVAVNVAVGIAPARSA